MSFFFIIFYTVDENILKSYNNTTLSKSPQFPKNLTENT